MPLVLTIISIVALLVLIMRFKIETFMALAIVSFFLALALGIPLDKVAHVIEKGIGGTLGHVGLIFGFGAILGKIVADAGGAQRISSTLINTFGVKRVQYAILITAFILGGALFFEVGIILLVPILFQISKQVGASLLYLGIPMISALAVTHGFLPPHPGPTVISMQYGAQTGAVLFYGIIVAIPTILISGLLYSHFLKRYFPNILIPKAVGSLTSLGEVKNLPEDELPSFSRSAFTAALPVILMLLAAMVRLVQELWNVPSNTFFDIINLIGEPTIVMLISVCFALWSMGISRNIPITQLMESVRVAIRSIAVLLLILGSGGAFKEILVEGGVGNYLTGLLSGSSISPLIFAWLVCALLRVAQGSATVASLSTAALVLPMLQTTDANPALMVLATGAGSQFFSHVNDAGFWIVKESFGLSIKQTFATWSVIVSLIAVLGLIGVLILNALV